MCSVSAIAATLKDRRVTCNSFQRIETRSATRMDMAECLQLFRPRPRGAAQPLDRELDDPHPQRRARGCAATSSTATTSIGRITPRDPRAKAERP